MNKELVLFDCAWCSLATRVDLELSVIIMTKNSEGYNTLLIHSTC